MAIKPLEDLRPGYAAKLREFAELIEQAPHQPLGIAVQITWTNTEVTRALKTEQGFNNLQAIGLYTTMASEFIHRLHTTFAKEEP